MITAKMQVVSILQGLNSDVLTLAAVTTTNRSDNNFAKMRATAQAALTIDAPALIGTVQRGQIFTVTFTADPTPAPAAATPAPAAVPPAQAPAPAAVTPAA